MFGTTVRGGEAFFAFLLLDADGDPMTGVTDLAVQVFHRSAAGSATNLASGNATEFHSSKPGLYYYAHSVAADAAYGLIFAYADPPAGASVQALVAGYEVSQRLAYLDAALSSLATAAALQIVDDELEVVAGNALNASTYAQGARDRFGSGITTSASTTLTAWLTAMAAAGATAPASLSSAGFVPSTDALEALRNRGDAAWVTGSGGATAEQIFEANPEDYDADGESFAARVLAILTAVMGIGANFTYTSSVSPAGAVDIYQGSDYHAGDGTAHQWAFSNAINLSGATVTLELLGEQYAAVVSGSSGAWVISVNMTAAETAALPLGPHPYEIRAVLASGRKAPPLGTGTATVRADR